MKAIVDTTTRFILEHEMLQAGDIILTAANAVRSKAIRLVTGGEYSHAMLHVGNGSCIHSDGAGVHSTSAQRLLFDNPEHARVLRLIRPERRAVEEICIFARTQIGKSYSVPEAMKSKVHRDTESIEKSNRQFCSRLVAQAYAYAGVNLVPNSDYCYPEDLSKSELIETVAGCVREALPEEVQFANSENPLETQAEATNFILREVRRLSGKDIQTDEQVVVFLLANPEHDSAVSEAVRSSGYLFLWKMDCDRNAWRYDASIFLNLPVSAEKKNETAHRELTGAETQLAQFKYMHGQFFQLWQRKQLTYFALQIQLYMQLIELANLRISTAREVLK